MRALIFTVERHAFAVPVDCIEEVFQAALPQPCPRPPYGCLGVIEVRGRTVPVLDVAPLLHLRRPLRASSLLNTLLERYMLLATVDGASMCLLIDGVVDVSDHVGSAEAGPHQPGVVRTGELTAQLLDLAVIIAPPRRRLLAKVRS